MRKIPASELIIHADGSIFHLHIKPEQLADRVILVGDPDRVAMIAKYLDSVECDISSREFHTVTGNYNNRRITVISHGIGGDNIDIVLSELDALANIDFETRTVKPFFRRLTLVRIGTSGSLQPFVPAGSYVAAEKSVGFDGVIYFYANNEKVRDLDFESAILDQLKWAPARLLPYVVTADASLIEQITQDDILRGVTIAANGFYGPQGRELRLPLADPLLNTKIEAFEYAGKKITNYEMESAALAGLAALTGHRAMTVCCIIAGRTDQHMHTDYKDSLPLLIEKVLNRIYRANASNF
ncbi:MAG: nucleoside phosphorylase [Tannerella sp.]|jgi:uridine phosphorylase|nr:nucleoside phosphorylase [Tannerella sp.]